MSSPSTSTDRSSRRSGLHADCSDVRRLSQGLRGFPQPERGLYLSVVPDMMRGAGGVTRGFQPVREVEPKSGLKGSGPRVEGRRWKARRPNPLRSAESSESSGRRCCGWMGRQSRGSPGGLLSCRGRGCGGGGGVCVGRRCRPGRIVSSSNGTIRTVVREGRSRETPPVPIRHAIRLAASLSPWPVFSTSRDPGAPLCPSASPRLDWS